MKMRLYSLNDYESELKGDGGAFGRDGYVVALKGYMMLEDEWLDCSPRKAAGLLGLAPEEYGVDEEHKAILLRRLPHGFPACARDCYTDAPEMRPSTARRVLSVPPHLWVSELPYLPEARFPGMPDGERRASDVTC